MDATRRANKEALGALHSGKHRTAERQSNSANLKSGFCSLIPPSSHHCIMGAHTLDMGIWEPGEETEPSGSELHLCSAPLYLTSRRSSRYQGSAKKKNPTQIKFSSRLQKGKQAVGVSAARLQISTERRRDNQRFFLHGPFA